MDRVVGGKYKLGRKLESGSFGELFLGVNVQTGEEIVVKLEPARARHPQLHYESKLYMLLQGGTGIPHLKWYGVEGEYNCMVIDLMGPSMEDLFNYCSQRFNLKTVLMLADQMLFELLAIQCTNSCKLIQVLMARQLCTKRKHDMWSVFGGKPLRFSLIEFGALTGLKMNMTMKIVHQYQWEEGLPGKTTQGMIQTHNCINFLNWIVDVVPFFNGCK